MNTTPFDTPVGNTTLQDISGNGLWQTTAAVALVSSMIAAKFIIYEIANGKDGRNLWASFYYRYTAFLSFVYIVAMATSVLLVVNTANAVACTLTGIFLYYLILTAFCLAFGVAVEDFLMTRRAFNINHVKTLRRAIIVGMILLPFAGAGIPAGITKGSMFGGARMCWVIHSHSMFSTLLPVPAAILLLNAVFYVLTLCGRALNLDPTFSFAEAFLFMFISLIRYGIPHLQVIVAITSIKVLSSAQHGPEFMVIGLAAQSNLLVVFNYYMMPEPERLKHDERADFSWRNPGQSLPTDSDEDEDDMIDDSNGGSGNSREERYCEACELLSRPARDRPGLYPWHVEWVERPECQGVR